MVIIKVKVMDWLKLVSHGAKTRSEFANLISDVSVIPTIPYIGAYNSRGTQTSIIKFLTVSTRFLDAQQTEDCHLKSPNHLTCIFYHRPDDKNSTHFYYSRNPRFPTGGGIKTVEIHHAASHRTNALVLVGLDVNFLSDKFPTLDNITIVGREGIRNNSGIRVEITEPVKSDQRNHVKVLQLVDLGIENLTSTFLSNFPRLQKLNVQRNNIQDLPHGVFSSNPSLDHIYLMGNRWNCSKDLKWVLDLNRSIAADLPELTCFNPNPKPYEEKPPLLTVATFSNVMKSECPRTCHCTLNKVYQHYYLSDLIEPIIEVNCSNGGFAALPEALPQHTKILHMADNEIEDLEPLKTNPTYRKVLDLYVDNNRITSIDLLEGSYWLRHFRVFSLSGNRLKEVPTYAIDNALSQNGNMPNAIRINLARNPWRCDCVFTPVFQEMLQKFTPQIRDINEVTCSYVEGDENSLLPIIELSRSAVCRLPSSGYSVQALDLLNGVLASLILLILGKLLYDYYYFKKTGRLPWIVTKMP